MIKRSWLNVWLLLAIGAAWPVSLCADESAGLSGLVGLDTPLRKGDRISFIGDSITMQGGYVKTIEQTIQDSASTRELGVKVFKRGLNGARVDTIVLGKTPWGEQPPFAELLKEDQPTVTVIFLGVNDVTQGQISPEQFEAGLAQLATDAKAAGAIVVLATPAVAGEKIDDSPRNTQLDLYAVISRKTADAQQAALCDLRKAFVGYLAEHNTENKPHGMLTYDGIHMNAQGNALLAEEFAKAITAALRTARPAN